MEEQMINVRAKDFEQLVLDVSVLKNLLLNEGELTECAKKELADARKRKEKISHESVRKLILEREISL